MLNKIKPTYSGENICVIIASLAGAMIPIWAIVYNVGIKPCIMI